VEENSSSIENRRIFSNKLKKCKFRDIIFQRKKHLLSTIERSQIKLSIVAAEMT